MEIDAQYCRAVWINTVKEVVYKTVKEVVYKY